jgi:hypothetical protein
MGKMNKQTLTATCFLTCLYAPFAFAQAATSNPDLASADWSVRHAQSLNAQSKDAVWNFINNLRGRTGVGELCAFRFADLRHSGQLSLVVSYDNGGRADCNMINIFDKSFAGISRSDVNATQDFSFDSIEDINSDGHHELIVDAAFAGGGGIDHCIATWPVVYAWNGTVFADVSTGSKSYYRKTLARLKHQITPQSSPTPASEQEIEEGELTGSNGARVRVRIIGQLSVPTPIPDTGPDTGDSDCQKAEAAQIERFLGISRDAGMSDAIRWAESDNPADREFAASVLADMGIPVTSDADRYVFVSSKNGVVEIKPPFAYRRGLVEIKPPIVYPTIQGQQLTQDTAKSPAK